MTSAEIVARVVALRRTVKEHKRAIAQHRSELQQAARELEDIEAECRRVGFGLDVTHIGAGVIHGQFKSSS